MMVAPEDLGVSADRLGSLEQSLKDCVYGNEVVTEQQYRYAKIRRNWLFYNGYHYVAEQKGKGNVLQSQVITPVSDGVAGSRVYDYILNYHKGDGKKLVGVLGRTPNMIASPIDPQDDDHVERAAIANKLLKKLRWSWNLTEMNAEMVLGLWVEGTQFIYTPFELDPMNLGHTEVHGYTSRPICQEANCAAVNEPGAQACTSCGAPMPPDASTLDVRNTTPDLFANGAPKCYLAGFAEVIIKPRVKTIKESPYLIYEKLRYIGDVLLNIPESKKYIDKIRGGDQSTMLTSYGVDVRANIGSQYPTNTASDGNRISWIVRLVWLDPEAYEGLTYNKDPLGAALTTKFPRGCKITFVNGYPVKFEDELKSEVWASVKPEVGKQLDTAGIGDEAIRSNRIIDDAVNMAIEAMEKGNPLMLFDPDVISQKAIRAHQSNPVDAMPAKPMGGKSIREAVYITEPVELNETPIKVQGMLLGASREITGVTASLFGGDSGSQTLGEAEMKRNMALMPHNVTWDAIKAGHAKAVMNGIKLIAKYNIDTAHFGGESPSSVYEAKLRELLKGGWHIECEEAIPMTWGQKRAQLFQLLDKGEPMWKLIGLNDPENLESILNSLGIDDLMIPGIYPLRRGLAIIKQLLMGSVQPPEPMPPPPPGMPPMPPPPPMSSIPFDPFADDAMFMVQIVKEWVAKNGLEVEKSNPNGYANVIAWGMEAQASMAPPPGMPGSPDGGPPPPGGPLPPTDNLGQPPPGGIQPAQKSPLAPEEMKGNGALFEQ